MVYNKTIRVNKNSKHIQKNHLMNLLDTEKTFNFLEKQQKCYFSTNTQKALLLITNV